MKTIKSIFAIAAVAISSVFGLSSCDKNDDAFNQPAKPEPAPVVVADAYLCIPIVEGQMEYLDATYNVSVDGKNVQVKLSDMTETKDANRLKAVCDGKSLGEIFSKMGGDSKTDKFTIYEYNLGKTSSAKINSIVYTSKGKLVDKEHEINLSTGYQFVNVTHTPTDLFQYFKGINDLDGFCETTNLYFK